MQRAATGLATVCLRLLGAAYGRRVALLVGTGNNGGDALYAGAALARRGVRVTAVLLEPDRVHAGGRAALRRAGGRELTAGSPEVPSVIGRADLVLDGMVGIGGRGGLRDHAAELARATADGAGIPVAVDVPFTAIITLEAAESGTRYRAVAVHGSPETRTAHEKMGFHEGWGAALDQLVEE